MLPGRSNLEKEGFLSRGHCPLWQRSQPGSGSLGQMRAPWRQPGNSWLITLKTFRLSARCSVQITQPPETAPPDGDQMSRNTSLQEMFHIQTVTFPRASLRDSTESCRRDPNNNLLKIDYHALNLTQKLLPLAAPLWAQGCWARRS